MAAQPVMHPTDRTLHAYGLGELDDAAARSVREHLDECPDCRRVAAAGPSSRGPVVSETDDLSLLGDGAALPAPAPTGGVAPGLENLPGYEVVRELGRGGMGVVYLARNTLMGRQEVLKVVGGHLVSRPIVRERFLREIRSAARLHHPNIVTAYTAMQLGEGLVLAMEYVDGYDLARIVKANGPMPVAKACNCAYQAALGLQHAHDHGMVHRDIKPANLILARAGGKGNRGIVKILDFGLAKVHSEGQQDSGLTREGQMLGTPDYIAPEQIRDAQSADIRADVYSLGCTLYYLLSGGPPFDGPKVWDVYQAHFSMEASPLNLARPEVPVELAALVAKMMAKEPGRRFQEPQDVAAALRPFLKGEGMRPSVAAANLSRPPLPAQDPRPVSPPEPARPAPGGDAIPAHDRKRPTTTEPGSVFEGLIDLGEPGPLQESRIIRPDPATALAAAATDAGPAHRPRWLGPAILAASVPAILLLAIIFYMTTNRGGAGETVSVTEEADLTRPFSSGPVKPADANHRAVEPIDQVRGGRSVPSTSNMPWPLALMSFGQTLPSPESGLHANFFCISPDMRRLSQGVVLAPRNGNTPPSCSIHFLNASDFKKVVKSQNIDAWISQGCFSPDGKSLAVTGGFPVIKIWDSATGRMIRELRTPRSNDFATVVYSPDGRLIAASQWWGNRLANGRWEHPVIVWDVATGDVKETFVDLEDLPPSLIFSPDSKRLVGGAGPDREVSGEAGRLRCWTLETRESMKLEGHRLRVQGVAFSPDGRYIASASHDRTAKVWDARSFECLSTFDGHHVVVNNVRFSPDGRVIASIGREEAVRVWDPRTGRQIRSLQGLTGHPQFVQFSPDGRWIYAGSGNILKAWETPTAASSAGDRDGDDRDPFGDHAGTGGGRGPSSAGALGTMTPAAGTAPIGLGLPAVEKSAGKVADAGRAGVEAGFRPLQGGFAGWYGLWRRQSIDPASIFRIDGGELVGPGTFRKGRIFWNRAIGRFSMTFEYLLPAGGRTRLASCRIGLGAENSARFGEAGFPVGEISCILAGTPEDGEYGDMILSNEGIVAVDYRQVIAKRTADVGKPAGQWNRAEVRCEGRAVSFSINGRRVARAEADREIVGHPGFQSWETDIRIRDVRISPLGTGSGDGLRRTGDAGP